MKIKALLFLNILFFFLSTFCNETIHEQREIITQENEATSIGKKEKITSVSLEAILKRMEERSITRSGAEGTFIQLLDLLQELLAQMKEVNNSLKEVAITTATAGVAAKIASDQLDLLLGE